MTKSCETHSWEADGVPVIQGTQTTQIQKCWKCGCVRAKVTYGGYVDAPRIPKRNGYGWKVALGMILGTVLVVAAAIIFMAEATSHFLPAGFTTADEQAYQTHAEQRE
jgi:hypothetical protein